VMCIAMGILIISLCNGIRIMSKEKRDKSLWERLIGKSPREQLEEADADPDKKPPKYDKEKWKKFQEGFKKK